MLYAGSYSVLFPETEVTELSARGKYRSKYYEQILEYLKSSPGHHFNVSEIHKDLAERGSPIGVTTIYRQLDRMVEAGIVNKYVIDSSSPSCYEYAGREKSEEKDAFYHCRCEICGSLIHLRCEELEGLQNHILEEHHFRIDPLRTVFYGICDDCMNGSEEDENGSERKGEERQWN